MDFLNNEVGISAKRTVRRGVGAIYIKESSIIEDFMTFIGAPHVTLSIMNVKILRDIRNNENRATNCVTRNISRTVGAASKHIEAIGFLKDAGKLDMLPPELAQTAHLRVEYDSASLSELAMLHEPPITKSGLNGRLSRILALADEQREAAKKDKS